jgi:Sporulation and spore germination
MTTDDSLPLHRPEDIDAPAPDPEPAPPRRGRKAIVITGLIVGIGGVLLVTALLPGWLTTADGPTRRVTPAAAGSNARRIQATLFYLSADGTLLVGTSRSVMYAETPAAQARRIVEAQIAEPPSGLESAIPRGTTVQAVFITDAHEAYVDLGGTITGAGKAVGSLDESLAVYAIVNAITVNLPDITAVQILVNGKEVDSLAGHLDLRTPLAKALDWVEKGS